MISSFQKLFDNGMICSSEQAAIVDAAIYDEVKAEFEAHQCVIISKKADIAKLEKVVLNEARIAINGAIVGHSAIEIAEKAGLKVPEGTKMLLAEIPDATINPNFFPVFVARIRVGFSGRLVVSKRIFIPITNPP